MKHDERLKYELSQSAAFQSIPERFAFQPFEPADKVLPDTAHPTKAMADSPIHIAAPSKENLEDQGTKQIVEEDGRIAALGLRTDVEHIDMYASDEDPVEGGIGFMGDHSA